MRKHIFIIGIALFTVLAPGGPVAASSALLDEVAISSDRVLLASGRSFVLQHGTGRWTVSAGEVQKWFKTRSLGDSAGVLQLRPDAIYHYLNVHVSPQLNDLGANSRFAYVDGNLHLLQGGRKGKIVDGVQTSLAIRSALVRGQSTASIAMKEYRPAVFSAGDFTKLQFPDHLTRGETNFAGSPANRIHNIKVATARFNGLVVAAGEEFSFNQYLGVVDASNGYLPELVIKQNVTTPEYGGGICQVSTTAFRAALQSGVEITSRRNHSYPVAYYGTPGFDATVYAPYTDFRFRNDTGQPVYLATKVLGSRVVFDVWGTNDGRQVNINGPFITSRRPDGSLTAAIAQLVSKDGKSVREKNFVSHYQSPDKFPTIRAANGE